MRYWQGSGKPDSNAHGIDVQTKAVPALENFGPKAKRAVPALVKLLNRPDNFGFAVDWAFVINALRKSTRKPLPKPV